MVKNGIGRIKISVRNMAESVAFFRDTLEMTLVAEATIEGAAMEQLWGLPHGATARAACLKNNEQTTLIELLEVTPNSGSFIRDGANTFDFGLFDIAFRARDIDAIYADFKKQGFDFLSAPVVYTADWVKVTVKEVIMVGPNRMPIALIERLSGTKPVIRNRFGTMVDAAQFVPAINDAVPFYTGILGYTSVFDQELPEGLIDEAVALPPGVKSRMALLHQVGTQTPAIELIQCSAPGKRLAADSAPPRFGLFALAFETGDLEGLLARIQAAGFEEVSGPVELETGVHGRIRAAVVRGPNHVLFEFFDR